MTPKAKFQKTAASLTTFRNIVDSDVFTRAHELAMVQFQDDLPKPLTVEIATANGYKLQGAKEFLSTLLNFAETPAPLAKQPHSGINYDA